MVASLLPWSVMSMVEEAPGMTVICPHFQAKAKEGYSICTKYIKLNGSGFPNTEIDINITEDLRETNQARVCGEALTLNTHPLSD